MNLLHKWLILGISWSSEFTIPGELGCEKLLGTSENVVYFNSKSSKIHARYYNIKGGLISESFSLWLKSLNKGTKNYLEHYLQLKRRYSG